MVRRGWVCCLACAAALSATQAEGQESGLKLRRSPSAGKSAAVAEQYAQTVQVVVKAADGKVVKEQKKTEGRDDAFTETVVAGAGGFPDKFTRHYTKSVRTRDGKSAAAAQQGHGIGFEKRESRYEAEDNGPEPLVSPADLKVLAAEATAESRKDAREFLLPKKPVKEGEGWTVSAADLAALLMPDAVLEPGTPPCELKLIKFYERDGVRCAAFGVQAKLPVKAVKNLRFDSPAEMEARLTLDGAVDGKGTALKITSQAKVSGTATAEMMGKRVVVALTAERNASLDRSGEKPDKPAEKAAEKPAPKSASK